MNSDMSISEAQAAAEAQWNDQMAKNQGPMDTGSGSSSGSSGRTGDSTSQATTLDTVLAYLKNALGIEGDYIKDKLPIAVLS